MRNLRTVAFEHTSLKDELPLSATAWDNSNDSILCAFGPTPTKPIIELKRKITLDVPDDSDGNFQTSKLVPITSWDAPCPLPDLPCDEILLMHYFPDTLTACIVLAGGDLILVREGPHDDQERIEIVGSVDVGIAAAAWASDEELLAVVTRSDSLVLMSRDLEPVTETSMTAEDLQASRHVSVGWGKKETQFQGKRAKAMRDPTMPEQVDEGLPSPYEDGKTSLSWRGDGAYLAVNSVTPNQRRAIRVYSREGALDSVSEPVDGLESALTWRPQGNLIASVKRSGEEEQSNPEIIFFERNGLRHGEFSLRSGLATTGEGFRSIELSWNIDSTVLAVSFVGIVQYWTMGNYHYYLKQEIDLLHGATARSASVKWHAERPLKCLAFNESSLVDLEYLFYVNKGSTVKPEDHGVVAVIDGDTLKLTPFKQAGVPPPMSFCEVHADSSISDVAISKNGRRIAILTRNGVEIWEWQARSLDHSKQQAGPRYTTNVERRLPGLILPEASQAAKSRYSQIVFKGNDDIFALAPPQLGCKALLTRTNLSKMLDDSRTSDEILQSTDTIEIANNAQNVYSDVSHENVWVQDNEGVALLSNDNSCPSHVALPGRHANCGIFFVRSESENGTANGIDQLCHKISLTSKGSLLADQRVIARDCTSFALTHMHLVYTTAQHLLKFVHLVPPEKMNVPGDTPEVDERCRSIERGAKIVTVMPSLFAVVLQMPRGNLETIYPRVLVLTGIRESLRSLEYRAAFLACQNQQVDLNILHDYLPAVFMANVQKFIDDLRKPVRVDEFISKLKEEDVTRTLYKDTLSAPEESSTPDLNVNGTVAAATTTTGSLHTSGPEKVNAICDAFISILQNKPGKFLQCIITAHVCKRPPDLPAALTLVSSLRQTSSDEADMAISHLCFLTDTNRLFDAALALYDLELTLLVAQNAQRDPREYMPFLQNLQSLPPLRRQFQIDDHLRNYSKALTSLHALEAHDEAEAYTVKHALYIHAIGLYQYSTTHLHSLILLYAEHLSAQSQHSAAATLCESLGDHSSAYPLYALAHQWRESLTCATLVPVDHDKLQSLALSLATTLAEESRDYRAAAAIHQDYLSDPLTSARLLCKGSYFAEATRTLSLHPDLHPQIPQIIDTGLTDKFSEILSLASDSKSQLLAQVPRILELRVKKSQDPLAFYGGDPDNVAGTGDVPDNISLAPTSASTLAGPNSLFTRGGAGSSSASARFAGTVASGTSQRTSKTRRREERKRARGRPGSVYEEEYLVASVARLVARVNGAHAEVGRLAAGLARRGMRARAARVDEVMREVVAGCEKAKGEVWRVVAVVDGGAGKEWTGEGSGKPVGADGVVSDSQMDAAGLGGGKETEVPVVKPWVSGVLVMR